jgi:hypothetical protein
MRVRYPMADLTIAELREIGKKMTPGPWEVYCDLNVRCDDPRGGKMSPLTTSGLSNEVRTANYEGIVQMRNLWDSLLNRLEAAEKPWVELTKETMPEPKRNAEFSDGVASVIGWYSDETGCVTWLIVNAVVQTPIEEFKKFRML